MAKVYPFRGIRYNKTRIEDLSKLVTQPYDRIDDKLMREYYQRSEFNFTRIIRSEVEPDEPTDNRYIRARKHIQDWLDQDVLIRDEIPSVYVYHQVYTAENEKITRKGFIALAETERFGKGVKAHEKTLEGPKADRLDLMRSTFADTGLIFMLYSDPVFEVSNVLDRAIKDREPHIRVNDDRGEEHLVWVVNDPEVCDAVTKGMEGKQLFVADGHHRYETACNFYEEKALEGYICEGNENIRNVMLAMVNMDEPGLSILPTHRLIFNVEDSKFESFLTDVGKYFEVLRLPFEPDESSARKTLFEHLDRHAGTNTAFGYYRKGEDSYHFLGLKDDAPIDRLFEGEFSDDFKKLDVARLHVLLDKFLGIDDEALKAYANVKYIGGRDKAISMVNHEAEIQCGFLINPTGIDDVKRIAMRGERMPQKSTDFYPKLLSGLVFNKMICRKVE